MQHIIFFCSLLCFVLLVSWGEAKRKCWVKPNKSAKKKHSKFSAEKYNSKAKLNTENNKLEFQNVKLPYRLMFAGCWSQFFKTDSVIYGETEIPSNIKTLWFQNMQLWIFYANRVRTYSVVAPASLLSIFCCFFIASWKCVECKIKSMVKMVKSILIQSYLKLTLCLHGFKLDILYFFMAGEM